MAFNSHSNIRDIKSTTHIPVIAPTYAKYLQYLKTVVIVLVATEIIPALSLIAKDSCEGYGYNYTEDELNFITLETGF